MRKRKTKNYKINKNTMTTYAIKFILERELDKLNTKIDYKIKRKLPYKKEARAHKDILKRINRIRPGISIASLFA